MSLPKLIGAYEDCFDTFDKASRSTKGARAMFNTYEDAMMFQLRMCQARRLQREENKRIYPPDSPQWGTSEYDRLKVSRAQEDEEGNWWVYIQPHSANIITVESLDEGPVHAS